LTNKTLACDPRATARGELRSLAGRQGHPETWVNRAGDPGLRTSRLHQPGIKVVVRGGVEPPTFRFSG